MRKIFRHLVFAFLAWLVPFVAAVSLSPVKRSNAPLFESLMPVVIAGWTVLLFRIESRGVRANHVAHALKVGALWLVANWLLDACMFSAGPMKMSLGQYASNIGVAYFMIPLITSGMGVSSAHRHDQALPAADARVTLAAPTA